MRVAVRDVRPGDIIRGPSWGDPARVVASVPSTVFRGDIHLHLQFQSGNAHVVRLSPDSLVDRLPKAVSRPRFCPSCGSPLYGANAVASAVATVYDVSCASCGWSGTVVPEHPQEEE